MKRVSSSLAVLVAVVFGLISCDKDNDTAAITITTKVDSVTASFSNSGSFTFFSFKNGAVVANADSATNKWDFAVRRTTFLINSASSGPGIGGAILQNVLYSTATAAPATGYAVDTTTSNRAIVDGSWYNYNPATRAFTPKAGQTFFIKTGTGKFAKMELLATDPIVPAGAQSPTQVKYKFTFTYQDNGTTSLQ
jgi:hypothetical protein